MHDESAKDLSEISTVWEDVYGAHNGSTQAVSEAQVRLFHRYGSAVKRYLRGILRDKDAADDLYQTFALRFVRGDFHRADPSRGRFRDYLKSSLFRLVFDHQRGLRKQEAAPVTEANEPAVLDDPADDLDRRFATVWRKELIARTWQALAVASRRSRQPLYDVLTYKTDHPDQRSAQIAEHFSALLGRPVTPEWVRKRLHQARGLFADLLIDQVAQSLEHPSADAIEEDLIDLGLLEHCRPALARRKAGA